MTTDAEPVEAPRNLGLGAHPQRLTDFMRTGWAVPSPGSPAEGVAAPWRRARRQRLAAAFPGEVLVIPSGGLKFRNHDAAWRFRPGSDFTWLAGSRAIGAVVVIDADGLATLYQDPPWDRDQAGWYTEYRGEVVDGPRPRLEAVAAELGIATAPRADLDLLKGTAARVMQGFDGAVAELFVSDPEADQELATWLAEARLVKDAWEVEQIQEAVDITIRGFEDVVADLGGAPERGMPASERWIEVVFNRRARMEGNDVGYVSLCAAGSHACTLHYIANDGPLRDGDLVLLDMGAENHELYTADITRTLPISGRFTARQRQVYDLVFAAQEAALAECRPGNAYSAPYHAAMAVFAEGLEVLGLVESAELVLADDDRRHVRWTVHRISHMLGLDVHDCAHARAEHYAEGVLKAGHVITVEPGLYFRSEDLLVPEDLRGTGIRIEDDVLITEDGHRLLSAALPRRADEVEAWMAAGRLAAPSSNPAPRFVELGAPSGAQLDKPGTRDAATPNPDQRFVELGARSGAQLDKPGARGAAR